MKIVIDREQVDIYETELNSVLADLGHPESLVTALSQVFDCGNDKDEAAADLAALKERPVNAGEHIWKQAAELSEKGKAKPVH